MLAPVAHILPLTVIQRERALPIPGRVVARKGQKVSPADVVAEAVLAPEHVVLDIARGLGLSAKEADKHLQWKPGDEVGEGDVIAGPVGFARRVVRTPRSGKVIIAGEGQVLLELDARPYELKAGFSGVVTELISERGVIIETTGALVQGTWGNGRLDFGLLTVLLKSPDDELTLDNLDISMRGAVVLGGHCQDEGVLRQADELPLRGLILGSMRASLVPVAYKLRLPVVVLDGFGRIPMNPLAFKLLSTSDRREVSVNASHRDRYAATRPEVVISLPSDQQLVLSPETDQYKVGQQVRVVSAPHFGAIGTLAAIYSDTVVMPNGLPVQAGSVQLTDDQEVVLPLVNLEVLE